MLEKADTDISIVMADLAGFGLEAAYLVPTETGMKKSIMDAHNGLRRYLAEHSLHFYDTQGLGPSHKKMLEVSILTEKGWKRTNASLYRPETKSGDPRIWFSNLGRHAQPWNLLVTIAKGGELYLVNASEALLWSTIHELGSPLHELVAGIELDARKIELELLDLLYGVASMGFVPSTTNADSGVGDTLEKLLGIKRNANKIPDYKGIELKSSRVQGKGGVQKNRSNLFSQVPDWSRSRLKNSREIVDEYGYISPNTGMQALQVTLSSNPNPQGLYLAFSENDSTVENLYSGVGKNPKVTLWGLDDLESRLSEKHKSTFWVKAETKKVQDLEHFQYFKVQITSSPLIANFGPLVASGKIQMDYTISEKLKPSGEKWVRDHGYLWKIKPANMNLLFPPPKTVELIAKT